MPAIALPTIALAGVAVVLAAIALFFLPGLLGLGSGQPAASPTATVGITSAPASVVVTEAPAATQQTYVVQSGDTMSKIANKFHVPLQTLINANPQIKNPNKLQIGDQVIIPVPNASTVPGETVAPSP
jgi:LysM repeat protein